MTKDSSNHHHHHRKSRRKRTNDGKADSDLSRSLSWALRHSAPSLGLKMSSDGYVPVRDLLGCNHPRFRNWSESDIRRVVASNDKQRYSLCERRYGDFHDTLDEESSDQPTLCIRANQGHTIRNISTEELLSKIAPERLSEMPIIVHGTYMKAWEEHIRQEGLSRMRRNHIHFASGLPTSSDVISGMRSNCQVYIFVDGKRCAEDEIDFFLSDNGVILSPGTEDGNLPTKYFSHVLNAKDNDILWDNR
mmetsp:Transcript_32081/g.49049  ORF Transcript_32081/g.49049 Transcript_32081/m.49049 type:complete len:248 (+) Transcript_32081:59-802(+)|eukprot:CAMPEP_0118691250 /NCGR_PEP_ID=MMETSP0800-20121206/10572_1 /TAXON_ID=210618 ORGANISM="Striatella unipunctata, Strain CCMP2910" /NCGR_SAMPLE_ID=MMETSP0800 /ASSEMBLY_ACC=CAM_ASM_000638 /LENGTH=247 /DNA_ID=CAMNT_0006589001 /DNA_START=34 /DNA_END=777 /DNA_ORIENTATION=-